MSTPETKTDEEPPRFTWPEILSLLALGIFVVAVWGFSHPFVKWILNFNTETAGPVQISDSYAAINTLFSGLAFGGLVAALFFQRKDLMGQFQALKTQVSEFKNQNDLTRQEMAFQEIHARIFNIPHLKVELTPGRVNNDLGYNVEISHQASTVYDQKLYLRQANGEDRLVLSNGALNAGSAYIEIQYLTFPMLEFRLSYISTHGDEVQIPFQCATAPGIAFETNFGEEVKKLKALVNKQYGVKENKDDEPVL